MAHRKGAKKAAKASASLGLLGAGASVFIAAAALATGSAVTAAPAHADFEDLLDPIIQPLLTSFTDSIAAFDPSAAADITSWTDSLLSSLGSFDLATPAAAVGASAEPAASTGAPYDLPVTLIGATGQPATEPVVNAAIDGSSTQVPLLVDTGSSGLVIPYTDLDPSNSFNALLDLFKLGFPSDGGSSGYSGGVEYYYLTYNDVPVTYADGLTTNGPVDIEVYSYNPSDFSSYFTNDAFQNFLEGNAVNGILGIGPDTAGPTTSPFESFGNVTLGITGTTGGNPSGDLIVGGPSVTGTSLSGAPISTEYISIDGGPLQQVSNDVDSGGVQGTIPASLLSSSEYNSSTDLVNIGTKIELFADKAGTEPLYSYTVTDAANDPYVVSGSTMDSGVEPFLLGTISMANAPAGTGTTIFGS